MNNRTFIRHAVAFCALALSTAVMASPPPGKGNGNGNGNPGRGGPPPHAGNPGNSGNSGYADRGGISTTEALIALGFSVGQRDYLRSYYAEQFRLGNCPPGLAKKNNGCQPPGQAKKWRIGYPLPGDVRYYDLPSAVLGQLGRAPDGYRYVRVANDILMLAIGTGLVVDAISNLGD